MHQISEREEAIMAKDDDNTQVFQDTTSEDVQLERFGYEQGMIWWLLYIASSSLQNNMLITFPAQNSNDHLVLLACSVLVSASLRRQYNNHWQLLQLLIPFLTACSWTALSGVFIVGVTAGGPPVMVYSFIGVSLLTLAVVIPMAEMCSMYPVAGGQYSWVAVLAPPKIARGLSYVAGWFMVVGICYTFPPLLLPLIRLIVN